jgi:hypothetical protein
MGILALLSPLLILYPDLQALHDEAAAFEEAAPPDDAWFLHRFAVEVDESQQTNASVLVAERELGAATIDLTVENLLDADWRSLTPIVSISWQR